MTRRRSAPRRHSRVEILRAVASTCAATYPGVGRLVCPDDVALAGVGRPVTVLDLGYRMGRPVYDLWCWARVLDTPAVTMTGDARSVVLTAAGGLPRRGPQVAVMVVAHEAVLVDGRPLTARERVLTLAELEELVEHGRVGGAV